MPSGGTIVLKTISFTCRWHTVAFSSWSLLGSMRSLKSKKKFLSEFVNICNDNLLLNTAVGSYLHKTTGQLNLIRHSCCLCLGLQKVVLSYFIKCSAVRFPSLQPDSHHSPPKKHHHQQQHTFVFRLSKYAVKQLNWMHTVSN